MFKHLYVTSKPIRCILYKRFYASDHKTTGNIKSDKNVVTLQEAVDELDARWNRNTQLALDEHKKQVDRIITAMKEQHNKVENGTNWDDVIMLCAFFTFVAYFGKLFFELLKEL